MLGLGQLAGRAQYAFGSSVAGRSCSSTCTLRRSYAWLIAMLSHPQLTTEEAEQADWEQWEHEAANRTSWLSTNHSDEAFTILSGPLKRMVIPIGHPRRCKYKLSEKYLKRMRSTREVAFDPILRAFEGASSQEEMLDDVPLEALGAHWGLQLPDPFSV